MSMTRKHFIAVTGAVAEVRSRVREKDGWNRPQKAAAERALDMIGIELADELAAFNYYFDRYRFLDACGEAA